jgi:orotidine-5'-phosphate decarboxylase
MSVSSPQDRIIVALDVDSSEKALDLVRELKGQLSWFKIGLQLFTAMGPAIVKQVLQEDVRVFLDLKLHDIPNTVTQAALQAAKLGVHMLTLHTLGGETMMKETSDTLHEIGDREGLPVPILLGVTVLTSIDQATLSSLGIPAKLDSQVIRLAEMAQRSGMDGIVASPQELDLIRDRYSSPFVVVTPGIRAIQEGTDDQARTMTASQAIQAGADFIVVGRPITQSDNPNSSASTLLENIKRGADQG